MKIQIPILRGFLFIFHSVQFLNYDALINDRRYVSNDKITTKDVLKHTDDERCVQKFSKCEGLQIHKKEPKKVDSLANPFNFNGGKTDKKSARCTKTKLVNLSTRNTKLH